MTPRTDVCHYCEDFRVEIVKAVTEADKTRLAQGFKEHVITTYIHYSAMNNYAWK